ncbi:hypothetical protein WME90_35570 [Sorangium sp. So ce375]|uniref:hypothetical protein n=1 Tax=Sorangium sp. So ce375 TaxID=3133306 RepID=UPI003F5B8038
MTKLSLLANAVRELEELNGWANADALKRGLVRESVDLIQEIGTHLRSSSDREALLTRCRVLRGEASLSDRAVIQRLHGAREQELFLFCGPLKTWVKKSKRAFHSFVCGVPVRAMNETLDLLNEATAAEELRAALGNNDIYLAPAPGFSVFDIVACGGEANLDPKHFAYFFPEDELIDSDIARTVAFRNFYTHRFFNSSFPLLRRFVPASLPHAPTPAQVATCLLTWMKGHDLGHSVRLPRTSIPRLRSTLGEFDAGILEEALADCVGYLLVSSPLIRGKFALSEELAAGCFLGEMLRFITRGRALFHDTEAAVLELTFLARHGYATLRGDQIEVSVGSLRRGMLALAHELVRAILVADVQPAAELLATYLGAGNDGEATIGEFTSQVCARSSDLPLDTCYIFS